MTWSKGVLVRLTRLGVSVPLVLAIGCGGAEPERGAGSIDVPRDSIKKFASRKTAAPAARRPAHRR